MEGLANLESLKDIQIVDNELLNKAISLLGTLPSWVYIIILVVAALIVVNIIKKSVKLAVTIGALAVSLSSSGIVSSQMVDEYKAKAEQLIEDNQELIDKGKEVYEKGQEAVSNITSNVNSN